VTDKRHLAGMGEISKEMRQLRLFRIVDGISIPLALCCWVAIAALDWATTFEIYFSAFYLVLIIAVSWKYGLNWGAAFAFASAGNQAALGAIDGHPFSSPRYF